MLLARLLSWLHLSQVVCPGSPDCLRFVLVLGERQAGKASLFSRLVAAPAEYAGQLGGVSAAAAAQAEGPEMEEPLDGTTGMWAEVGLSAGQQVARQARPKCALCCGTLCASQRRLRRLAASRGC